MRENYDLNKYQEESQLLAVYPNRGNNIIYPALGIGGEAGEVVDKVKKLWRNFGIIDGHFVSTTEKEELVKELGDVLWYITAMSEELGTNLNYIAKINVAKLRDRNVRGVVASAGDNR